MCGILGKNIFKSSQNVKDGLHSMMHRGIDGNNI